MLLSLLYENKRYAEVFDLYREIRKNLELYESSTDKTMNCLAFAACYHLVNMSQLPQIQRKFQKTTHFSFSNFPEYARAFSIRTRFVSINKASETNESIDIFVGWISIKAK